MGHPRRHMTSGIAGITRCGRGSNKVRIVDDPNRVTCILCVNRMTPEEIDRRNQPVRMVERTNLLSGVKYMEPEDTPNYMSPSSEAYWSM